MNQQQAWTALADDGECVGLRPDGSECGFVRHAGDSSRASGGVTARRTIGVLAQRSDELRSTPLRRELRCLTTMQARLNHERVSG